MDPSWAPVGPRLGSSLLGGLGLLEGPKLLQADARLNFKDLIDILAKAGFWTKVPLVFFLKGVVF